MLKLDVEVRRQLKKKTTKRDLSCPSCSAADPKWFGFAVKPQHFHHLWIYN